MTDIVKGMTAVAYKAQYGAEFDSLRDGVREEFMRAALLFFADNGSEEIAKHLCRAVYSIPVDNPIPAPMLDSMTWRVAAAIRAVAGGEG